MTCALRIAIAAALLAACSDGGMQAAVPDPDPNGQTGSPGAVECDEHAECRAKAEMELAALSAPENASYAFEGAECIQLSVMAGNAWASGPACECAVPGGGSRAIGPAGLDCYVLGRAGDCLWKGDEWNGCTVGETDTCDEVCDELARRLEADAERAFETRLVHAACAKGRCSTVVEIEGRCYADGSYRFGRGYDCALPAGEILNQERAATAPPEPSGDPLDLPGDAYYFPYGDDSDGFVELVAGRERWGAFAGEPWFGGFAQFYSVSGTAGAGRAEIIDPLEGIDDCGVFRDRRPGGGGDIEFLTVDELVLIDGDRELVFALTPASNAHFSSYGLELEPGEMPRFGGLYDLRGGGGSFGADFTVTDLRFPDALAVTTLEQTGRVPRAALALRWTGRGQAPLRLRMWVADQPENPGARFEIECLLADDGAHELPADVLAAVPEGFVDATFEREQRVTAMADSRAVVVMARVSQAFHFALGEPCEQPEVAAACDRYADAVATAYDACGGIPVPPYEQLCPDYIAESCASCPEYYDCLAQNTRCTANGLMIGANAECRCPER